MLTSEWVQNIRVRLNAAPKQTTKELDDCMTPNVWRIVEESARQARREQGCSARPKYVATVYDLAYAVFYADASRDIEVLLGEVDRLRRVIEQATEGVEILQVMTSGELTREEAAAVYEHASDLGDRLYREIKDYD